ncbi:sigma-70 family RNA polymerase sigma factor [Mangrovivirga sp. M17]|uniref:Sigma-70 family RNA polymerase sigma factor n=1 Tax=Mangrovivirga halotolerans TaxID=2993936 RepID=A0ABT3RNW8_9BACT|nr:sigma-70 family RNA polymerase sigma factor [Mangrovivirga halotolerans]MCX2743492.1 sigma-70 family RNA polymerase sigma factor [Mangrovivirga halotolerans]
MFLKRTNISSLSDLEIIEKYNKNPDHQYISILYDRYIDKAYGVALKYLKNREYAKDIVMEVYAELGDDIKKHEIKNFSSWLYVKVKNASLMRIRKEKPQLFVNGEKKDLAFMELSDNGHHDIEEKVRLEDNLEQLKLCIDKLKAEQKECVEMFFLQEKSYSIIEKELSIKLKKVKSYIQNGKRNLKICMETALRSKDHAH